ncbi:SDR family NAD(P)-dependent oxidoreductase [Nocardioides sp. SYSU D00038]|uniref:SDR family NAD(P)-dependent oxidoreductase n=1 Tax=Nocardioides sp. SYSU D00038 TaxID=2812554 RepID=UPI001F0750B9|nr:SDR family oxidoreductase [Nocardioides sp. SYSU D00038]
MTDKVALVTGGSKGIGLAVVRRLVQEGARVVTGARTTGPELAALVGCGRVVAVEVDLATADGPARLVEAAVRSHGRVDVLVNNVGASEPGPSIEAADDAAWARVLDATLLSAVRTTRAAIPVLSDGGAVVTIGSGNARHPDPYIPMYSAAKAALTNFSLGLARELGPRGIRVNTVSPGPVRTPLWTADDGGFAHLIAAQAGTSAEEVVGSMIPQALRVLTGRFSEPEEVADLVVFLASARAANLTGADVAVDGGMGLGA